MNKILQLLDESTALDYLKERLLPLYPEFKDIARLRIEPYKKMVWETTYHVVICFQVRFIDFNGKEKTIPVVCSAHSDEPRKNVFSALKYLWAQNLNGQGIDLPRPLFYSQRFNGTFYRALEGENLLHYIKEKDFPSISKIVIEAAHLFARLHALPAEAEANFNPSNARIHTVIPGVELIYQEMTARYGDKYTPSLKKVYDCLITREEKFFASGAPLKLIHGDAHPENIIKTAKDRIGLIDFTDLCLSDFARDLGSFLQQLEYKIISKIGDAEYAAEMKKTFLESYLAAAGMELTADLQERIGLYYNWTAIRTSTYWFLKFEHNEERAGALLEKVKENLKI